MTMKRIFLSTYTCATANRLAASLRDAGHYVVSMWHHDPDPPTPLGKWKDWAEKTAQKLQVLRTADVLLVVTSEGVGGGEASAGGVDDPADPSSDPHHNKRRSPAELYHEAGFFHGWAASGIFPGRQMAVVGPVECGVMFHPAVKRFGTLEECVAWLG